MAVTHLVVGDDNVAKCLEDCGSDTFTVGATCSALTQAFVNSWLTANSKTTLDEWCAGQSPAKTNMTGETTWPT